jgi:hypothetical protein
MQRAAKRGYPDLATDQLQVTAASPGAPAGRVRCLARQSLTSDHPSVASHGLLVPNIPVAER